MNNLCHISVGNWIGPCVWRRPQLGLVHSYRFPFRQHFQITPIILNAMHTHWISTSNQYIEYIRSTRWWMEHRCEQICKLFNNNNHIFILCKWLSPCNHSDKPPLIAPLEDIKNELNICISFLRTHLCIINVNIRTRHSSCCCLLWLVLVLVRRHQLWPLIQIIL